MALIFFTQSIENTRLINMKAIVALCAIVLVLALAAESAAEGCVPNSEWTSAGCVYNKCDANGKSVTGKTCAEARCAPGKQAKWEKGDQSKPYPECCGRLKCED